eukprot:gene20442-129_t
MMWHLSLIITLCFWSIHARQDVSLTQWQIGSSNDITDSIDMISAHNYHPTTKWISVQVPSTVIAGQIQSGVFKDVFFNNSLNQIDAEQYTVPWFYRTEVQTPGIGKDQVLWLRFEGINYKAQLSINGKMVADTDTFVGAFRYFDFDITSFVAEPKLAIVLKIWRPHDSWKPGSKDTDLAVTLVDWAPMVPDSGMGIWRDVELRITGKSMLQYALVDSKVSPDLLSASLAVKIQVNNTDKVVHKYVLYASISSANVPGFKTVTISKTITAQPGLSAAGWEEGEAAALTFKDPPLWWPNGMGPQNLLNLTIRICPIDSNTTIDTLNHRFGIREVTGELSPGVQYLQYRVNHQKVLVRGGGWAPDMFLRYSESDYRAQLTYVRDIGLNTIRCEGKMNPDEFFDLADEFGIMIFIGWACCDAWQHWPYWTEKVTEIAMLSMRDQGLRLRGRASILTFLFGSDMMPPVDIEKRYRQVMKDIEWPNPTLISANNMTSPFSGLSGVKMTGPYQYVPPNYWFTQKQAHVGTGGAFGFNTETSP